MMSAAPTTSILNEALAAYDAGLCVVRTTTDGKKKPYGTWKRYQSQRPTRDDIIDWFGNGHPGMGVICGAVSGDLEMFELEGRFMAEHADTFYQRIKEAGLELLFKRLTTGYHAVSPSDGRHFIYRVDGPLEGNTKLAANPANETLIETRGEGGFTILAPSHGPVHPTGKPWAIRGGSFADIITITASERAALFAVARTFDEGAPAPPPKPPAPSRRTTIPRWTGGATSGSWMDDVVNHLDNSRDLLTVLEQHGWTYSHNDRHGRQLVTRPDKTEDVSGSINENGRLCVFSSSTPFDYWDGRTKPTTYDTLDVIAMYEHSGDRKAAARHIAETTGILHAWQQQQDRDTAARFGIDTPPAAPPPPAPTGLDDAFWTARPILAHIQQAARSRLVSPTAVLGAVLARVAAYTPPSSCLPALIGSTSPLSLYVALRGSSGAGKSSPAATAADLFPHRPPGCVGPLALGSGEGLVEAFMDLIEETDSQGKKRKVKKQIHSGALFSLDEGQALAEIGSRKGSTILPVLRTAWSGGDPGQANASIETRRSLKPGTYAVGLISLWQDHAAAVLLADEAGGTPQRFIWFGTGDPEAGDNGIPDWPGEIDWQPPAAIGFAGVTGKHIIDVHDDIRFQIKKQRIDELRGITTVEPLDAHRRLNKLKIAGVLAVIEGRHNIDLDDWDLAETIMTASDAVRSEVIASARRLTFQAEMAGHERAVTRETVIEQAAHNRALTNASKAVARKVHRSTTGPVGHRELARAISSQDRQKISADEAIHEAERLKWVRSVIDGWAPGEAKPA